VAETSCVGEENFMYPRGNLTFVTYISGIVDYGYYYAARTQAAVDNFHVNNLNPFNNGTKPTTSAYGVPYTGSNSRLLWGWLPEGSSQSVQQNIAQGWAGVMSLPRLLTLEYHEGSNTLATGSTFTQQSSQNFMYNSEYYLTPTQQQSRAHIAPSLNLVIAPAPAIEYLRVVKEAAGGESSSPTTLSFGDYSTSQEAVEALYESAGINKLSGDIVLTANTTIAPLTLQIVDAQNNVFASVSLQQTGGGNETLQQTLTVNGIACNCSSLFGFNTPAPINATQKADYNFYAANTPLQLRIILDASVIEVFVNGRCTLTQRVYQSHFEVWPKQSQRDLLKLRLLNTAGLSSVQTVQVWQMIPISSNRMTNIPPVGKSFSVD
jgi:sucrose-6-phosphate hydrolase SacC (GH32 family)